jgi:hypothetical protein
VKGSAITKTTCWVTGLDAGRIYWERTVLSGDFVFELSLSYDARLKKQFDPLIAHINASWHYWKCEAGRISACGLCTQRCRTTADCEGKREVCKAVTCPTALDEGETSFGNGCVDPEDEFSIRPGMLIWQDSE